MNTTIRTLACVAVGAAVFGMTLEAVSEELPKEVQEAKSQLEQARIKKGVTAAMTVIKADTKTAKENAIKAAVDAAINSSGDNKDALAKNLTDVCCSVVVALSVETSEIRSDLLTTLLDSIGDSARSPAEKLSLVTEAAATASFVTRGAEFAKAPVVSDKALSKEVQAAATTPTLVVGGSAAWESMAYFEAVMEGLEKDEYILHTDKVREQMTTAQSSATGSVGVQTDASGNHDQGEATGSKGTNGDGFTPDYATDPVTGNPLVPIVNPDTGKIDWFNTDEEGHIWDPTGEKNPTPHGQM